ncbi:MAG: Ig-like domain-containing protein [Candidatus Helarchaeota archaeon]
MNVDRNSSFKDSKILQSEKLFSQSDTPIIFNITSTSYFVKNGDFLELFVRCDGANYSVSANFSQIDSEFSLSNQQVLDYNNGTYRINYTIQLSNLKPDGIYSVIINATNVTSGQFVLDSNLTLTLDNTLPSIVQIISPIEGAFLSRTFNITTQVLDNETDIASVEFWDGFPEISGVLLSNDTSAPFIFLWNTTHTLQGPHKIYIRATDLAGNQNISHPVNITIDNTLPTFEPPSITQNGRFFLIFGNINGTFSPIKHFEYSLPQFSITSDPTGLYYGLFALSNSGQPLADGNYTLTISVNDSVDFLAQINIPLTVDLTPPVYDLINHTPAYPEYNQSVLISVFNATDATTGIKNITLYYSAGGNPWTQIDITSNYSALIPPFPFQTVVTYYVILFDNMGNQRESSYFSYTVNDTRAPVIGMISRIPRSPTQYMEVNISVTYVSDVGSGIKNVFINYSVNLGQWHLININYSLWGIIPPQTPNSIIYYQLIVIDGAGNVYYSPITSYSVSFDYTRLLLFLLLIGSIIGISTYSGFWFYSKKRQKSLRLQFLNEYQTFKRFIDLRIADLDLIIKDSNAIELKLDNLLQFQWVPPPRDQKDFPNTSFSSIKQYIGISQLLEEISQIQTDMDQKLKTFSKKFAPLNPHSKISESLISFNKKIETAYISVRSLETTLKEKYPLYLKEVKFRLQIEFPLTDFDQLFAKVLNEFQKKYDPFVKEFNQLLASRKIKEIEWKIEELSSLFKETDEWFENAKNWSHLLPIPKGRGYKYLLNLKRTQYLAIKNEFQLKIEKIRAELKTSIDFAQNFIRWTYNTVSKKLNKFKSTIFEEIIRFISTEGHDISTINSFLEEKFTYFNSLLANDRVKMEDFYESHKEYSIQDLYNEWLSFINEIPLKLNKLREKITQFIPPIYRVHRLIDGITSFFYQKSMNEIKKFLTEEKAEEMTDQKISPLNVLFSRVIWQVNRIDNEINRWVDLLPFDLETPQYMLLLQNWNSTKEEIFDQLNTLSKRQKVYKCEIMHELLDPLNDEIWECSNCGAIACGEHLEKWFHRKEAPECFKCGAVNTFKLKFSSGEPFPKENR